MSTVFATLLPAASVGPGPLAVLAGQWLDIIGVCGALILSTIGMTMQWHLHRHRMSMEERVKDGEMTEEVARAKIRFRRRCAPIATMLGVALLAAVAIHSIV
ncbi:MAG: hypothetical protein RLZZ15_4491 [Verrucomicrobiota bacterium]